MKLLFAVALVATSLPSVAAAAVGRSDTATSDRRHCTQITMRAGSRLSGRRVCRTPSEWREALGADWRQRLAGYSGTQDDADAMATRAPNSWDGTGGVVPPQRTLDSGGIPAHSPTPQ